MTLLLLTQTGTEFTFPDNTTGRVIWIILAAILLGAYFLISRTRRRAKEDYIAGKRHQAELRANDPDMKKEE